MITPQAARMLTRYNHWANELIFEAVAGLPEGEAAKERQSLFKNMIHTLNHNYVIDLIWQAHLEGASRRATPPDTRRWPNCGASSGSSTTGTSPGATSCPRPRSGKTFTSP